MPVPFPTAETVDLSPPGPDEVQHVARGVLTAIAPPEGLTRLQLLCMKALSDAMTDHVLDLDRVEPISAHDYALGLARRDAAFRVRMVQMMVLLALLLRRLPAEVAARLREFADELSVGDDCRELLTATRHLSSGALGLAKADFERNGYETMAFERTGDGADHTAAEFWAAAPHDTALAARWAALEQCPDDSLGRRMWEFYRARGFRFPGTPGSAPPALAQHDWIHVLADYGTTVESELEVFGLISRASDDPRAFSLLVQVLGLFESGYLQAGMGLFEMDLGHISTDEEHMATRLADAFRRGARAAWSFNDRHGVATGIDLLAVDWFEHADKPVAQVRAEFFLDGAADKRPVAVAAGSVGPWEKGGISPFQAQAGRELAEAEGRPYEAYGAEPC
ncbi:MAG TPA: hypothetical protein VD926_15425 [Acidimicrobiales bacterium]|nr:hypothetical protein [Acidimicrobiales bacterium]